MIKQKFKPHNNMETELTQEQVQRLIKAFFGEDTEKKDINSSEESQIQKIIHVPLLDAYFVYGSKMLFKRDCRLIGSCEFFEEREKSAIKNKHRFIIIERSISGHCCFEYSVIDTKKQSDDDWYSSADTVSETFRIEDAIAVCYSLNKLEEPISIPKLTPEDFFHSSAPCGVVPNILKP